MKNVALFGGNFDPPHLGHVLSITNVLNSSLVDEVLVVPAGDDRYDRTPNVSAADRRDMTSAMIDEFYAGNDCVQLETAQVDGLLPDSTAIDLVNYLLEKNPDRKLHFVVGADNMCQLESWKNFEELRKKIGFIVVPRRGVELSDIPQYVTLIPDVKLLSNDFSSSKVRELILAGSNLSGIVPKSAISLIIERRLYAS